MNRPAPPAPAATNGCSFTDDPAMRSNPVSVQSDPPADPDDAEFDALLAEPFASAWAADVAEAATPSGGLRGRLLERLSVSRAASAAMFTSRLGRLAALELAPGVSARTLYAAPGGRTLRPGEPARARLIELQPGARWDGPDAQRHREWLVVRGLAHIGGAALRLRDYHVVPAGAASGVVSSDDGALLFLRESALPAGAGGAACTVRDAEAGWADYAPGIQRRVLWQHEGQAAMLYRARPGASVPLHTHGHDEECLMLQGEVFLDDELLQEGDYQLAPAGTGHRITETDTGVIVFAHGDLDLKFAA